MAVEWGPIIGGLISAAGTVGSSVYGGKLKEQDRLYYAAENQKNRLFQSEEADKARDWNYNTMMDLMNKENEYNSADAQLERLLATGMNPATAIGMLSETGNSSASGQLNAPGAPSGSASLGSMDHSTIPTILSNAAGNFAETLSNLEEFRGKRMENAILAETKDKLIALKGVELEQAEELLKGYALDNKNKELQNISQELLNIKTKVEADVWKEKLDWEIKQAEANYDLTRAQISETDVRRELELAQKGLVPYQEALLIAEAYYNREAGKHAGDKSFEQWLVGTFGDRLSELADKLLDNLKTRFDDPSKRRKLNREATKAYEAYKKHPTKENRDKLNDLWNQLYGNDYPIEDDYNLQNVPDDENLAGGR